MRSFERSECFLTQSCDHLTRARWCQEIVEECVFMIKGANTTIKCSVTLYFMYFERQVCVLYLSKLHFFHNCVYLLMILFLHEFGVISLCYESPLATINYLQNSCQTMLLNLNVLFAYPKCIIHSQNWRTYSCWWLKMPKELRLVNFLIISHTITFGSNLF